MGPRRPPLLALLAIAGLAACEDQTTPLAPERTDPGSVVGPDLVRVSPISTWPEGYLTVGEERTGYIVGPNGRPLEVTYQIHEGFAVWQGDILIGREGEIAETAAELDLDGAGPLRGVVISADGGKNRWPGGVVPYTTSALNPPDMFVVNQAIRWIEDQTPGVTFVYRTSQSDYVTFRDAGGCSSPVGRMGGQQFINLRAGSDNPCSIGVAAHEILHTLGLYHEHARCDRDDYVVIDYGQIIPGRLSNFFAAGSNSQGDPCGDDQTVYDLFEYDFGSIMHYSFGTFALGSDPTIIPIVPVPEDVTVGQRAALSDADAATVGWLYGSNNAPPVATVEISGELVEGTNILFDASTSTDPDDHEDVLTYTWIFGDGTCPLSSKCSNDNPTHFYRHDGTYGWALLVGDGFDAGTAGGILNIANADPIVDAGPDSEVASGEILALSASFSDKGAFDDPWTWIIDWGDGTNATGSSNFQVPITASHQVCEAGTFTVEVSVTDKDGGTGSDKREVSVSSITVEIDILPGSAENPINLKRGGTLPVAILGSPELEVSAIDPTTLVLGDGIGADTPVAQRGDGSTQAQLEDVNGDGVTDLVVKFPNQELAMTDLTDATIELVLRGVQTDGCAHLQGVDVVNVHGT